MFEESLSLQQQRLDTPLSAENAAYIEDIYESYLQSPQSVSQEWQDYFTQRLSLLTGDNVTRIALPAEQSEPTTDHLHSKIKNQFLLLARNNNKANSARTVAENTVITEHERKQVSVLQLIAAYRNRGHQKASLDPLGLAKRAHVPDLELSAHGLSSNDLSTVFQTGNLAIGKPEATLGEMVDAMEAIYCSSVGAEYMHIVDTVEKRWVQQYMESAGGIPKMSDEAKLALLERLTAAEGLEKYLGNKYVGAKRFGLEGAESFIPMVNEIVQRAGTEGTLEVAIGMAHRGRLNLLVNIMGKSPADLFGEFEGKSFYKKGSGDVKYHQGFSCNVMTKGGETHLALMFNPSHLEIVNPVVEGSVRARQARRRDAKRYQVIPILVHGDAAFAGQGVVMETFQMSQTRGYTTGGSIHIVINNQVGFTTSNPEDARSTEYCTDIAKMVQCPIFHVNGDDPEAVLFVTQMAVDFRMAFKKDVVIDLFCYRRRGHNESDEPFSTQPLMYKVIADLPTTRTLYAQKLVQDQVLNQTQSDEMVEEYRRALESGEHVTKSLVREPNKNLFIDWSPYLGHALIDEWETGVSLERLKHYATLMHTLPEGFVLQKQVQKVIDDRLKMQTGELPLNWGAAEVLAYASLLDQDYLVRITGQDVGRGTFSHRHAELFDQITGDMYVPLLHISPNQGPMAIYDSLLSEEAVLAFEYGYATTMPKSLIVWEAQFGDFANGAQVVIDQFISSGETKWERVNGLTLLLPHGFEGQGPEHSSARLERYLQLCAEENMQVCTPTTPAQIFHVLRRQAVRPLRKPLVIMSPKSLLRHKLATSDISELVKGSFQTVIDDVDVQDKHAVTRLVLCGGKVYYDLLEKRRAEKLDHIAIVRIEQIYPYPEQRLSAILAGYSNIKQVVWCQEEPKNQGAWMFLAQYLHPTLAHVYSAGTVPLFCASRNAGAAPACGSAYQHAKQQADLIAAALDIVLPS